MLIDRQPKTPPPRQPPPRQPPPRRQHTGPKPVLPMVQLPIFRVKMADFEDFLHQAYGTEEFEFLVAAGIVAGECPEYIVRASIPEAHDYQRKADHIRNGGFSRNIPLILNVLCIDGLIPVGKYTIDTHPQPTTIAVYTALMKVKLDGNDPDCIAFKRAYRHDGEFLKRAERLDKAVAEAVQREQDNLR